MSRVLGPIHIGYPVLYVKCTYFPKEITYLRADKVCNMYRCMLQLLLASFFYAIVVNCL